MRLRKLFCAVLLALFSFQMLHVTALADEGMWPFNNVPRAEIKRKYGFDVTDAWLKKVQMSAVRFNNGGSGSFVSPTGLVLTNYHIVEDFVHEFSTPQHDYAKDGFLARAQAEEQKIPNLELNELISIEDVTDRVNGAVKAGASAADAFAARRAAITDIEADSTKQTSLRSDVVTLYQGGRYNLYRYKKYTDVRLVFAPEFQAAFFGGDPDNFNFPRFNIDMALVRVYENGQPIHPENYLKWSTKGTKEGELVFVAGHPGSTSRLNTVAHLEELRDVSLPLVIRYLEHREAVLKKYMAMGEEQTEAAQNELNSVQNSLKVFRGQLQGLQDRTLMERKLEAENALRKQIAADPKKQAEYGDAWDAIAKAHRDLATYAKERRFLDLAAAFNTQLFTIARNLVRLADENEKPNAQRLPEFTDARRASLELALFSPAPMRLDLEKLKLADSLAFMRDEMGADNPLGESTPNGKTPKARATELIDGAKTSDIAFRRSPLVWIMGFSHVRKSVGFPPSAMLSANLPQGGDAAKPKPAPIPKKKTPSKNVLSSRTPRRSSQRTTSETSNTTSDATSSATAVEMAFWNSIKDSTNPDDFRAYLKKYPDGQFAEIAQNRITNLEAAKKRNNTQPSGTNAAPAVRTFSASYLLVERVLNGKAPEARAAELIDGTRLTDVAFRRQLAAGGRAAIESSTDPMIVLARSIDKEARDLRKRYENEVISVERTNYAKIARALFETEGDKIYPDATFTLRLSYGAVKGYMENGHQVEPFTTLGGLYDRMGKYNAQFPYNLPPRWLEKKSALNLKTPFNFVSTNDIIGGNSGSPTINKDAELVGLIFDGNIQSLVGNFYYDESVNRAISVDSRGMLEVLRKVFNANELADELTKG